ncbi:hypothetical protein BOSE62_110108 [Bosea sp. 62]|nr:hypothetical protein BOSE21B_50497 [Bosea sp. 21B]CAD5290238.1 hypothetical protein BOSE46_70471 [Bosea sp. 46]CAD5300948.1 hypothetical protein BOSE7B_90195 [Bosea sp. 7B]VVT60403.1 hypothetical protein BOS5A_211194 [Bosea sp. EC-HK365B]VXA99029.1 hypothetical protein BOSE62_110108 [Bosea sp. 62]VXB59931.1 hypothetical protein BOSE127_140138 [Bosea sp. 127]VXC63906.1 hypothetical protein BOSE29B_50471 [Bosea sp. 29B]VXC95412.1 hypothetical protein BOSE125_80075 [Bosea sp. 125]
MENLLSVAAVKNLDFAGFIVALALGRLRPENLRISKRQRTQFLKQKMMQLSFMRLEILKILAQGE